MGNSLYVIKQQASGISLWKSKGPSLRNLDIEFTQRCNNNCLHCCINLAADDLVAKNRELTSGEIKGILKEASSLGYLGIRFTGGEPLLREDFEEVYVFARKQGLKVAILTNATLITPHLAELFSRISPLEKIEVSIYGLKKSSYEAVTRSYGSFEAVRKGIGLLLKHKVPFAVKGALLSSNKEEIDEFRDWAATIPGMNKPPIYAMFFDLRYRRDDPAKNEVIKSVRMHPQEGVEILTRGRDRYLKDMKRFCSKLMKPREDKLFSCGLGACTGCIDAYGNLLSCLLLRHPDTTYDLKKGSLKDALVNFFPRIRKIKATNPEYLRRCARCFLKGLCGQCPGKSWTEYGTLDTPVEYLCEIAHSQARLLGLLGEKEKSWEKVSA